jgi:hypothetical protein
MRDHLLRNNGKDVSLFRNVQPSFSTHERKTKSKNELLKQIHKKHKKRFLNSSDEKGIVFYIELFPNNKKPTQKDRLHHYL